jgi:DNA ligase D-like protein (predicted polymerase)
MSKSEIVLELDGVEVTLTNPDKIFFPQLGKTKLDVVNYYLSVADGVLRGVRDRPMNLKRFPNGAESDPFYQKRAPTPRPDWVRTATVRFPSDRTADEVVCSDLASLAWVINLGCIDLNPWPIRMSDVDHPDELRVDLDPEPAASWDDVRNVALVARDVLADNGLIGFPKTSGSRGIHINVRIEPNWPFDEVRRAAIALAREMERRAPEIATTAWWKEERHGGVFVDTTRTRAIAPSRRRIRCDHAPTAASPRPSPGMKSRTSTRVRSPSTPCPNDSRGQAIRLPRSTTSLGGSMDSWRFRIATRPTGCWMRRGRRTIRKAIPSRFAPSPAADARRHPSNV